MTIINPSVITDIATGAIQPIDALHLFDDLIGEATVLVNRTNNAEGPDSEEYLCAPLKTHVLTVIRNICDELLDCYSDKTIYDGIEANPNGGLFTVDQAPDIRFRWYLTAKHDLSDKRKTGYFADLWRGWNDLQTQLEKSVAYAKARKREAVKGYIEGDFSLDIPGHDNYVPAEQHIYIDCLSAKLDTDEDSSSVSPASHAGSALGANSPS